MAIVLTENGVTVSFPDDNYFQFDKCGAYNTLKGHNVKEMDICWLETGSDTLWIVELKAFYDATNPLFAPNDLNVGGIVQYWIDELYKKSVHTLCMLETNRTATQNCINVTINTTTQYRLIHLINVIPGQETFLQFIQDELRMRLKPFLSIFRANIAVIPYNIAQGGALVPWII